MVFCGGNWSIRDWMHFQMGGQTYGSQHFEKVEDFIRRKIRPDGFSTFNRAGTPSAPPPVTYWAEEGHSGEHVKRLQAFLNGRGAGLAVDGDFGPATKAAVVAFQRSVGVDADGIVGPITLQKLKDAGFHPDGAPTPPPSPPVKRFPEDWTDRELLIEILRQLRGPTLAGWNQLGGKSVVDKLAEL
ncbi:peptidoglycan-binding protein [Mycobacterium sp. NAZ190054]|uniref:peptidoglycan-binding domain-containing protein n=1 Tax=Mycobacterium sp. NAZ190054 TaxID=1747766 RepID=UPI00350EBA63